MPELDEELSGIFETIEIEQDHSTDVGQTNEEGEEPEPVDTEPVAEGADAKGLEGTEEKQPETKDSETKTETKTEPLKTETKVEPDWKATLPPPPPEYQGKKPEIDEETGQIKNMTLEEYQAYNRELVKTELRQEAYQDFVEHRSLDAAEQLLPELKSNPSVRAMVENARIASVLMGKPIDSYEAAKQVRDALGIAPAKIAEVKAAAERNAKASITVQKNAALETGSSKASPDTDKIVDLQKRVQRGDDEAFAELLDLWDDVGAL